MTATATTSAAALAAPPAGMQAGDINKLFERIARDCPPYQGYRELIHNAFQAVLNSDPDYAHRVMFTSAAHIGGLYDDKLCLVDTGVGMNAEDAVRYLGALGSSGQKQGVRNNFGIGVKISAGYRNPAGLVYTTVKDGQATRIEFGRLRGGRFGIMPQLDDDGNKVSALMLAADDDTIHPLIREAGHGTQVILMGNSERENTLRIPADVTLGKGHGHRSRWLPILVNRRYFTIPGDVPCYVIDGDERMRAVKGQRHHLDTLATARGTVALDDAKATAHWWIMPEREQGGELHPFATLSGHVGFLHEHELYDHDFSAKHLIDCGVTYGHDRVVIYFESTDEQALPNMVRTSVEVHGQRLPLDTYKAAFRRALPQAIEDLVQSKAASANAVNHDEAIGNRLANVDLYGMNLARPDSDGEMVGGIASTFAASVAKRRARKTPATTGECATVAPRKPRVKREAKPSGPRDARGVGKSTRPSNGTHYSEAPIQRPTIRWTTEAEGNGLEGYAARYVAHENLLIANSDYPVIQRLAGFIAADYADKARAQIICEAAAREIRTEVGLSLVEAAINALQMHQAGWWSADDAATALSEVSLSMAANPGLDKLAKIKKRLTAEFGAVNA